MPPMLRGNIFKWLIVYLIGASIYTLVFAILSIRGISDNIFRILLGVCRGLVVGGLVMVVLALMSLAFNSKNQNTDTGKDKNNHKTTHNIISKLRSIRHALRDKCSLILKECRNMCNLIKYDKC